jgi:hypothetical protein
VPPYRSREEEFESYTFEATWREHWQGQRTWCPEDWDCVCCADTKSRNGRGRSRYIRVSANTLGGDACVLKKKKSTRAVWVRASLLTVSGLVSCQCALRFLTIQAWLEASYSNMISQVGPWPVYVSSS